MSNEAGFAALQRQIDRIRSLPKELVRQAGPEIAKALQADTEESILRQQGPGGDRWLPTASGAPALRNAAPHVTTRAIGTVILQRVDGVEARHHSGTAKGKVVRQIIPVRKIPDPVTKAIKAVLDKVFFKIWGGR